MTSRTSSRPATEDVTAMKVGESPAAGRTSRSSAADRGGDGNRAGVTTGGGVSGPSENDAAGQGAG